MPSESKPVAEGGGKMGTAKMPKLNPTQRKLLGSAHDNEYGEGWLSPPNGRQTTKDAFKDLERLGLAQYTITDKWAGWKLTNAGLEMRSE